MTHQRLYHSVPFTVYPLSVSTALIRPHGQLELVEVDSFTQRVLGTCRGAKTLEQHAMTAFQGGMPADPTQLEELLEALVRKGLLCETLAQLDAASVSGKAVGITAASSPAVAVITHERPEALRRCLSSLLQNVVEFGHRPRVLVVDGSREHRNANQAVVSALSTKEILIEYWSTQEVARLHRELLRAGHSPSVVHIALEPGGIGANRNIALALTAGTDLIMIDDDVICDTWCLPGRSDGFGLAGHDDPRETEFFSTRADALAGIHRERVDFIEAHGRILGRSLAEVCLASADDTHLENACVHLLANMTTNRDSRVRCSFMGLAGDSARYCPFRLLLLSSPRQQMMANVARLELAMTSREVRRVASRTTITHDPACMAYCVGVANSRVTPPFVPKGANEDGLFGTTLMLSEPQAVFAHLPFGIVHDSDRGARYEDVMPSARETRISELLMSILHMASVTMTGSLDTDRTVKLGRYAMDIGQLPLGDFKELAMDVTLNSRSRDLLALGAYLNATRSPSHEWVTIALDQYRSQLRLSIQDGCFCVPVECRQGTCVDDGFRSAQQRVRDFGELLTEWSGIWVTAAGLHSQGTIPPPYQAV